MKWKSKGLLAVAAVAMAALIVPAPASAATLELVGPPSSDKIIVNESAPERVLTAQETTDVKAVLAATSEGAATFDADAARAAGALPETVDAVATAVQGDGGTVIGSFTSTAGAETLMANAAAACTGKSGFTGYFQPWGAQFALTSCDADRLTAAIGLGAAGAGLITAILIRLGAPPQVSGATALVGAILAFGAAALVACKAFSSNGGIYLNVLGRPPVSCWGQ